MADLTGLGLLVAALYVLFPVLVIVILLVIDHRLSRIAKNIARQTEMMRRVMGDGDQPAQGDITPFPHNRPTAGTSRARR